MVWDDRGLDEAPPNPSRQLERLLAGVLDVLGDALVGAYLHGSAVLGGLGPRSDLDVLAVTRGPTTVDEKRRLVEHLLAVSNTPFHVELTIVVQSQVRPWRYPPGRDFQYGDWWRAEFEAGELEPWEGPTDPDLATLLTIVLLGNHALHGPLPADVLEPVPRSDWADAMRRCVPGLLVEIDTDTRNVVLTLARVWNSLAEGTVLRKDGAAEWALERLPDEHRRVLARARAIYLGEEDERWDDLRPQVNAYARHVVTEIGRIPPPG